MVIDTISSQCLEEWKKNKRKRRRNNRPDKGETLSQLRSRIVTLNVALLKRLREKNSLLNRGIPCNILLNKDILSFAGKIMELKEREIGKNIIQQGGNHSVTRNRQIQFPGLTIIY